MGTERGHILAWADLAKTKCQEQFLSEDCNDLLLGKVLSAMATVDLPVVISINNSPRKVVDKTGYYVNKSLLLISLI